MTVRARRRDDAGLRARVDRVHWRLDASTVTRHANGMVDAWGVATRVGVFSYSDGEGGTVREYVPPQELFAPDSIATLHGVPFTVQHPASDVTADNASELTHGWVLEVRPKPADGTIETRIRIATKDALAAIEGGTVELSCGYETRVAPTRGVTDAGEPYDAIQTERRYNHLALVDMARVGHVARLRLDGVQRLATDPDDSENSDMGKVKVKLADGRTIDVPEILVPAWRAGRVDAAKRKDALNPQEVTIAGETMILPEALVQQLLALLGGGSASEAVSEEPPASTEVAAVPDAAPKFDSMTAAQIRAEVARQVAEGIRQHADASETERGIREMATRIVGKRLDGNVWDVAAVAIGHAAADRRDDAKALATHAKKDNQRAQGRLLGMLEMYEMAAREDSEDVEVEDRADAAESQIERLQDARAQSLPTVRMDSLERAAAELRRRKMDRNRKPAQAAAGK